MDGSGVTGILCGVHWGGIHVVQEIGG